MIKSRKVRTRREDFNLFCQTALESVGAEDALANVVVEYAYNPYYRKWEGGFQVPAHEFYINNECIIRIYWNYTNGGSIRWIDFDGLARNYNLAPSGANGRSMDWTPEYVAQVVVNALLFYPGARKRSLARIKARGIKNSTF